MAHFKPMQQTTAFRKMAAAMWRAPNDPTLVGHIDVDFSNALEFVTRYHEKYDCKVTPTHLVGRAIGMLLSRHPEANAKVGIGQILLRQSADINFVVAAENGRDLWGIKLQSVNEMRLSEIEDQIKSAAMKVRGKTDQSIERGRWILRFFPIWLLRPIIAFATFVTTRLGLDLGFIGFPRDAFGGAVVTSVGMYGIKNGHAALPPPNPSCLVFAVMKIEDMPWVVGNHVIPRPILRINWTFDHRIMDAFLCAKLLNELEHLLNKPEEMLTDAEQMEW